MNNFTLAAVFCISISFAAPSAADAPERLRVIIETDAGGDPDDEQSLVRFLLYANEWDIEGIIANRPVARERENLNRERTGFGIVQRLVRAYQQCYPALAQHDPRYPAPATLLSKTVAGYNDRDDAVQLIIRAVDKPDPRPIWYSDWGTDQGGATNNLRRALDRILRERGQVGYANFKNRLRLSSGNNFGEHTTRIPPAFQIWVNTFQPEIDRRRWYHRFSALTARAGGFDLVRDVLTEHGPLGALYPTNTTHWQKEGDSMTFLYLAPTGMNDPNHPGWGSWAGRYGLNENFPGKNYFWANQIDVWNGTTNRDNTLARWAEHLQNDFRARLDWCVKDFGQANHPPNVRVRGPARETVHPGEIVKFNAVESSDPDGNQLRFDWIVYPRPIGFDGAIEIKNADTATATMIAPRVASPTLVHLLAIVTDNGSPPLTRYGRAFVTVKPL